MFPNSGLFELYGATEVGWATMLHPHEQYTKLGSVGRECVGSAPIRILDPDGNEVPDGEAGELYCSTPYLFDRYWNLPEKTAAAFNGRHCTVGDMARRDEEGYIHLVDRKSNMIISGGENIYPSEVEAVHRRPPDGQGCRRGRLAGREMGRAGPCRRRAARRRRRRRGRAAGLVQVAARRVQACRAATPSCATRRCRATPPARCCTARSSCSCTEVTGEPFDETSSRQRRRPGRPAAHGPRRVARVRACAAATSCRSGCGSTRTASASSTCATSGRRCTWRTPMPS